MKKTLPALATIVLGASLAACTQAEPATGGEKDIHGCLPGAGQSWSYLKQQCVQVFAIADIKLPDPADDTLAVYVILSDDKSRAEVFAADLPENTLLEVVKGGYASQDGKVRLHRQGKNWRIMK